MKPILMNTEMVKAILAGTKTVTRRLIKLQPYDVLYGGILQEGEVEDGDVLLVSTEAGKTEMIVPPYQPGDVLYVRETWAVWSPTCGTIPEIIYKADGYSQSHKMKWRPSIHMPKKAARIFLRVIDVRVERLQDITDDDLTNDFNLCKEAIQAVGRDYLAKAGWNSTIKKSDLDKYGWDANPWVWVIGFERISKEEANK